MIFMNNTQKEKQTKDTCDSTAKLRNSGLRKMKTFFCPPGLCDCDSESAELINF